MKLAHSNMLKKKKKKKKNPLIHIRTTWADYYTNKGNLIIIAI